MNRYLILFFAFGSFAICSCDHISGSGNVITEKRNTGRFEGVLVRGSIDVEVSNGSNILVEVEADDNILPDIITEIDDGMLTVYYRPNTSFSDVHAKVYVTAPELKKLYVRGSGNIESKDVLKSDERVQTGISGSGDINAKINAPAIEAEISGSGNMVLEGRCKAFRGKISGSGDLKCQELLSENTTLKVSGSGSAHVYSSVHLDASASGSGDIYYGGKPTSTQINKSGSGSIEPEQED